MKTYCTSQEHRKKKIIAHSFGRSETAVHNQSNIMHGFIDVLLSRVVSKDSDFTQCACSVNRVRLHRELHTQ